MGQMPRKAIIGLVGVVASMGICQQTRAQDARAVLAKTLRTYQGMTSYEGKTSVDVDFITPNGSKQTLSAQSSALLFKRPNKFVLKMTSSKANIEIYGDGKTLTIFNSDARRYYSLPSPPDMPAILILLHDRIMIDAVLDPLFFLSSPTLPSALGNIKMGDSATTNGHSVFTINGVWEVDPLVGTLKNNQFCTKGTRWTLFIDKSNAQLQKAEARIPAKINVRVKRQGKTEAMPMAVTLVMKHIVVEAMPNIAVPESAFTFKASKGVSEQKDVKQLLEGSAGHSL